MAVPAALATFRVGGKEAKPFVTVPQLKDHLALLNAFAQLRARVERTSAADLGIPYFPPETDKERRWSLFVGFAVERFERWCLALKPAHTEGGFAQIFPPLDVLMVWHTYMLNPGWYAEDLLRISVLQGLKAAGRLFSAALGNGLGQLLATRPTESSVNVRGWAWQTEMPFDIFAAIPVMSAIGKQVQCPECGTLTPTPYLSADGTGYLQLKFARRCANPSCAFIITHDALAMAKLAWDLAMPNTGGPDSVLAGTVFTPGNMNNLVHAVEVKDHLIYFKQPQQNPVTAQVLMRVSGWTLAGLKNLLWKDLVQERRLYHRITAAYSDGRIFSVELVSAVLRQAGFVEKMHKLEWTKPGTFDAYQDEMALYHVIARYHAFLDLMAARPRTFLVPTLDIDLAWHTHQLRSEQYAYDTTKYVNVFVDHDDKVEENRLSTSFDDTGSAWKRRFGVEYTYCGCFLPGTSVGSRLAKLMGSKDHSHTKNPSYLEPPAKTASATHPSAHNAVFRPPAAHKVLNRGRKPTKSKEAQAGGAACVLDPAFLVPVPLFAHPNREANCAAVSGNLSSGERGGCSAVSAFGFLSLAYAYLTTTEFRAHRPVAQITHRPCPKSSNPSLGNRITVSALAPRSGSAWLLLLVQRFWELAGFSIRLQRATAAIAATAITGAIATRAIARTVAVVECLAVVVEEDVAEEEDVVVVEGNGSPHFLHGHVDRAGFASQLGMI
ncbi:hypothetical protein HMN09_00852200 [Mycena chlorophos]|uniref:Uncharacterized protein n=1 Tax=Mycena chlorophos TaxID=658473 RepID=A0A8H6SRF8_MYCCL|nr:hypothetical protein HMN09_00852200 [Mycena chlorophos]